MLLAKAFTVAAFVLLTTTDCPGEEHIYAKVCADTEVKPVIRVADDQCDRLSTNDRYRWRYYEPQVFLPAVGKPLPEDKYAYTEPSDSETLVRIPEKDGGSGYSVEHK